MSLRKVGYKSPPEHSRFRKGQSGNPSGRKKKIPTLAEDFASELAETIQVNEGGKPRRITKQRALVKSAMANGIKGNMRATSLLLAYCARLIEANPGMTDAEELTDADRKILEGFLDRELGRRQAKAKTTTANNPTKPAPANNSQTQGDQTQQKDTDQ